MSRGWEKLTPADVAKLGRKASTMPQQRRSKYGAVKTTVDGITFDSKREAARYVELKALAAANEIAYLQLQPEYPIEVNGIRIGIWRGDFRYHTVRDSHEATNGLGQKMQIVQVGPPIVEDVKGYRTEVYRLKKKLVEAQYGIQIREIR